MKIEKFNYLLILLLFTMLACNPPATKRSFRDVSNQLTDNNAIVDGSGANSGNDFGSSNGNGSDDDDFNNSGVSNEPGFSNCDFNLYKSEATLGQVSVCQSSIDPSTVKVKFSKQDYSQRSCLIPMHKLGNGNSFYLGVAQCMHHSAGQVLSGNLVKNRQGYTQYAINNAIVLKQGSLNAFYSCMDAVSVFVANNCPWVTNTSCNYPNPSQRASCQQCITNAYTYQQDKCNQFTMQHSYLSFDF